MSRLVPIFGRSFFFCRDRDRLFSFDFMGLSFVVSLLISSAFPCLPVMDRGRAECGCRFAVVVGRPRWFGTGRRLTVGNFFLLEAPRGPLDCKFFCGCELSNESCSLLIPFIAFFFDEILQLLETCTAFGIKFHGCIFCGFSHYYFCR